MANAWRGVATVQHLPYNMIMLLWDKQFLHFLVHCGKMANSSLLQVEEMISCLATRRIGLLLGVFIVMAEDSPGSKPENDHAGDGTQKFTLFKAVELKYHNI